MWDVMLILAGFGLLFLGGEWIVKSSTSIARHLGLSALLVSVVVVGFGTSTPELLVSMQAAMAGSPDIALGNVVGSNICNILLILGLGGVLGVIACGQPAVRREAIAVVLVSLLLAGLAQVGVVSRGVGVGMLLLLAGYLTYCVRADRARAGERVPDELAGAPIPLAKALPLAVVSIVLLVVGAKALVTGSVSLARGFGVSEAVIGLTLVAVGTSLPELAATIAAVRARQTDVIVGNVLGSNLFNILAILGLTAAVSPIPFDGQIADVDVWVMLAVALSLLVPVMVLRQVGQMTGAVYLALYVLYIGWLVAGSATPV